GPRCDPARAEKGPRRLQGGGQRCRVPRSGEEWSRAGRTRPVTSTSWRPTTAQGEGPDVPGGVPALPGCEGSGDPPGQVSRPARAGCVRHEGSGLVPVGVHTGGVRGGGEPGAGAVEAGGAGAERGPRVLR